MIKKLVVFACFVLLFVNLIVAANVAYISKSSAKVDDNILGVFDELGFSVDIIDNSDLPLDLSEYNLIFIGDEAFTEDIPISEYPSVIINSRLGAKFGLTDTDGISKMTSSQPLKINKDGNDVEVYTSAEDNRGIAIPYYFLSDLNKAESLESYARTFSTSSDKGDVISYASKGDVLKNGDVVQNNICFFGIVKTNYWTQDAKQLFEDCVKYSYDYSVSITCSNDGQCGTGSFVGDNFCSGKNVVRNYNSPKCTNPATVESYCSSTTEQRLIQTCSDYCVNGECKDFVCEKNTDCNDNNPQTLDECKNPSSVNAVCTHTIIQNVTVNITQIRIISFVATPGVDSVTLSFSANPLNGSILSGYYVAMNKSSWTWIKAPISTYVFLNLAPSTDYVFYVRAINNFNISSDEVNVSVRTLNVPSSPEAPASGGGGGGGYSGGGGGCITEWACDDWNECINGIQKRTCSYPTGFCVPTGNKPSETQFCTEAPKASSPGNEPVVENTPAVSDDTNSPGITGAVIGNLGKYSVAGIIAFLMAIGGAYWYIKFR